MDVQKRLQEIEAEVEKLEAILTEKEKDWWKQLDIHKELDLSSNESYSAYLKMREPEVKRLCELDREQRMIMPYELKKLPDYGDVMPLKDFLDCVKSGGFIDYDGFGYYVKDNQETDIMIHPSDLHYKAIRKDFDTIVWFNR